ncbi:hypothetical protein MMYC01_206388 [Madurella mycetomatis]|uniref:Uncharacterized protein n=1 Tax=Madurella mycetomatis TaxID=100816 RepID=A0A175W1U5_9PEZI|nr:hypothetical protein MMYC01_206388 [Madurella mycetomatis]
MSLLSTRAAASKAAASFSFTRATTRRVATSTKASARPTPKASSTTPSSSSSSSSSSSKPASQSAPSKRGPPPKWKRMIWTAAFAAVTFTGTIYGAGLKTQREWKAEKQKIQEATADDKVAMLEQRRADLMRQKGEIEGKLAMVRARMEVAAAAAADGEDGEGDERR